MEWISVKYKLPKDFNDYCKNDAVLVCAKDADGCPSILYGIAQWYDGHWDILGERGAHSCTGFYIFKSENITHWMRFPDQPERSKRENNE